MNKLTRHCVSCRFTVTSVVVWGKFFVTIDILLRCTILGLFAIPTTLQHRMFSSACSGMISYVLLLGSRYIEDADRQHFRDSIELKETIRIKHMAEQEKDARIEAESNAADTERKMSAFLCHEIRNPLNGKTKTAKQKSSAPLQPLSERNVTPHPPYD
jgi:hypothetical protein